MSVAVPAERPELTEAGLAPTHAVQAIDEFGEVRELEVAGEFPLTIKVDEREVVTLMTLGTYPEALTLGYLRNQRLIEDISAIKSVTVDWDREQVAVTTHAGKGIIEWEKKLSKRTVTTGCGQGTVFSCTLDNLYEMKIPRVELRQSLIYALLRKIAAYNEVYKKAGAVHGCALCKDTRIDIFIEDVGRHNAADAISGLMWLDDVSGGDKIFYTTGRLTSEIVMKCALMGIPALLSRSGVTHMGLELAAELGIVMIARAKGKHFLVYNGADQIDFDDRPPMKRKSNKVADAGYNEAVRARLTGVILAGGRARRMGGQDKGLIELDGKPMIEYITERLSPQVGKLLINANRNRSRYAQLSGYTVIEDSIADFAGPLAGMASGLHAAETDFVLTVPCDSPLIAVDLAERLYQSLAQSKAKLSVAHDGVRLQPVFALIATELLGSLLDYLNAGGRKIDIWYAQHDYATCDLSDRSDTFLNINTPSERDQLETRITERTW